MRYFPILVIWLMPAAVSAQMNFTLNSHLKVTSVSDVIIAILNIMMVVAVPIIIFFLIFAGFQYVTAQGNAEKIKSATRSLTYVILGAILILGSFALSTAIKSIVDSFRT